MDVDAAVVELYGLLPEQFTATRNRLARMVEDAGDARGSAAVKALRKPTLSAWLANQLVRTAPDGIHELTEVGEQLRQAHLAGDGSSLRQLTRRRYDLVRQLAKTARAQARELGRPVSEQTEARLIETLDAAVVDPGAAQLLRSGHLTSALRHVGFGVVDEAGDPAQLAPLKPRVIRSSRPKPPAKRPARRTGTTSKVDSTPQRRRIELESRVRETENEYAEAEAERIEAESQLDAHEHLMADLEATIARLSEQLEHARQQSREAKRRTRALQVERDRTTRNARVAQRRRDDSEQRLASFDR
jgi:hypothetical protein